MPPKKATSRRSMASTLKPLYLVPFNGKMCDSEIFAPDGDSLCLEIRECLKEDGYLLKTTDYRKVSSSDAPVVFFSMPKHPSVYANLAKYPKAQRTLYVWEPPTTQTFCHDTRLHQHFSKVVTINHRSCDSRSHIPFWYPRLRSVVSNPIPFHERKLCTLISANKRSPHPLELYSSRRRTIDYFEEHAPCEFDCYGIKWDCENLKTYRGLVDDKRLCLQRYRFYVAYENCRSLSGYITEKIFDCFEAGCVPIYWGPDDITEVIPKECYILKTDFGSELELHTFLKSMTEGQHRSYLEATKRFVNSSAAKRFTHTHFIEQFRKLCVHSTNDVVAKRGAR